MDIIDTYIDGLNGINAEVNTSSDRRGDPNDLFYCPECKRVFKEYFIEKKYLMYMDSSFPKYQVEKVCPECKKKVKKGVLK